MLGILPFGRVLRYARQEQGASSAASQREGGGARLMGMGVAIVTGVFTILLAIVSWLLTNGSRRSRLLSRIERQVAILKDLPQDHAARAVLNESLTDDASELQALGIRQSGTSARADSTSRPRIFRLAS